MLARDEDATGDADERPDRHQSGAAVDESRHRRRYRRRAQGRAGQNPRTVNVAQRTQNDPDGRGDGRADDRRRPDIPRADAERVPDLRQQRCDAELIGKTGVDRVR